MFINESECIYCGACAVECAENAVEYHSNSSYENYLINNDVCTECPEEDFPLCYSICPMNCIKLNDERL